MKIKFCGFTEKEDIKHAVHLGVDAIGIIFYEQSPRYVSIDLAEELFHDLPPFVNRVGVFVNHDLDVVNTYAQRCQLDYVQLHGEESVDFCLNCNTKVIKSFRVATSDDLLKISPYQGVVDGILLDTKLKGTYGGTGKTFDWGIAIAAKEFDVPLLLSGGITIDNCKNAIQLVAPYALDVSSGIESEPGKKDYEKMTKFLSSVTDIIG
ncbi:phosphoribosylanthranilate isomerase [Candidatus Marinamargulisbacteria bacterium SCGC AG-414-C22]|nr:phosphoribosylanthranilate isomerase [Candidatus Marinamargulisbacteria bacterium SCGC AG-414-C22]